MAIPFDPWSLRRTPARSSGAALLVLPGGFASCLQLHARRTGWPPPAAGGPVRLGHLGRQLGGLLDDRILTRRPGRPSATASPAACRGLPGSLPTMAITGTYPPWQAMTASTTAPGAGAVRDRGTVKRSPCRVGCRGFGCDQAIRWRRDRGRLPRRVC